MPGMYADNVVMAKIKALYGRRLTDEDYRQLLQKKSVSEVAAYLKRETYYGGVLAEIKEDLIHRGQLENLINRHKIDIYERLLKYSLPDSFFPKIYAVRNEIEQLLAAMRMLNAGKMDRFIVSFPVYLDKYLSFDLFSLARIRSFDDLLEVVRHSDYYRQLGPHRPVSQNTPIDVRACEATLLTNYYRNALAMVDRRYRGKTRDHLSAILRTRIDLHNLTVIYRSKRFSGETAEEVQRHLIPIKTRVSTGIYGELSDAGDAEAVISRIQNVRILRRHFREDTGNGLDHAIGDLRQRTSRRIFRFSIRPVVVLMSYMELLEIEASNLVNIIEGIRYALPPDEIKELLILS